MELRFTERAWGQLRKLPREAARRLVFKLEEATVDPRRHLVRLRGVQSYRLRVGDYRAVVDLDWTAGVLWVLGVHHRSDAYR